MSAGTNPSRSLLAPTSRMTTPTANASNAPLVIGGPPDAGLGAASGGIPIGPLALLARNVRKTYQLGRVKVPVLRGVNLDAHEGEFVAILGASGSGKSTLLHVVGGLDRPDAVTSHDGRKRNSDVRPDLKPDVKPDVTSGSPTVIEYRGQNIASMSRGALNRYRAHETGFVFQFYHLLPELTVLQNVTVAAMVRHGFGYAAVAAEVRATANDLLTQVGLGHRLSHRPAELSGGERQRVAIARSLINRPSILLADEPTGNLDRATGGAILDMLLKIREQRKLTMLVVTHDIHTAQRADRVVRLADGLVTQVDEPGTGG